MTNRIANSAGRAKQHFELGTRGFVSFFASARCITETDQARACNGVHGRLASLHAISKTGKLLPDPVRAWWHGLEDKRLDVSILDINKVYGALFELVGIFETLHDDESVPFSRDVAVSRSTAQLDAMLNHVTGFDLNKATYISWGNNMFGTFDSELLKEAQTHLGNWFPLSKKTD